MGAWGTSLYANDSASDIRGDYVDKLRRGKTNEEATKELIDANCDIMGDTEEEPLFWSYSHSVSNIRRKKWLSRLWRKMPYGLVKIIGPFISRKIY